jgi:adenine-specific DNA-methyltransferase
MSQAAAQLSLESPDFPVQADYRRYPQLRYMGSKYRLLPWIESVLATYSFVSVLDAFSGSGCVAYLLKTMGKRVHANDFLRFAADFARATIANSSETITPADAALLTSPATKPRTFVQETFRGVFFDDADRLFIDTVRSNLDQLSPAKQALALAALYRSCLKKQPRGVFTVAGSGRYDDGRRDLRLRLHDHFVESVEVFNGLVFDNGQASRATCADVFSLEPADYDLVYLDPPYVPRADDNCYIKRYHFLEGLSSYWKGVELHPTSKVRKLRKRYTPFSYRRDADEAFARLFERFEASTIVLSYSSNGYPDIDRLVDLLGRFKTSITVHSEEHRYHFGTHSSVSRGRAVVTEYLVVGE